MLRTLLVAPPALCKYHQLSLPYQKDRNPPHTMSNFFSKRRSTSVPPSSTSLTPSSPSSPLAQVQDQIQDQVQDSNRVSSPIPISSHSISHPAYPHNATPSLRNLPVSNIAPFVVDLWCSTCKEQYSTQLYTTTGKRKAPICNDCFQRFARTHEPAARCSATFTSFPPLLEDPSQYDGHGSMQHASVFETGYGYTGLRKMVTGIFSGPGRKSEESVDRGRARSASVSAKVSTGRGCGEEDGSTHGGRKRSASRSHSAVLARGRGRDTPHASDNGSDSYESNYTIVPELYDSPRR
ncbi:hypothetical protein K491DRAFT_695468 [Lophiostoma macrostomum CBS 122681]|uniref:Uncharacterized protein n=1 Tax=Lophiostoma macrostomum CBS 122681 TaxID=1314788 RepID=A0A6A6T095_9PLEO|nr:hypothetical protein K491DRAFT_695468 [Lophiostoma macrostomum CBS 122681]